MELTLCFITPGRLIDICLYFFVKLDATNSSHQLESKQAENKIRLEASQVCTDNIITRKKV